MFPSDSEQGLQQIIHIAHLLGTAVSQPFLAVSVKATGTPTGTRYRGCEGFSIESSPLYSSIEEGAQFQAGWLGPVEGPCIGALGRRNYGTGSQILMPSSSSF